MLPSHSPFTPTHNLIGHFNEGTNRRRPDSSVTIGDFLHFVEIFHDSIDRNVF